MSNNNNNIEPSIILSFLAKFIFLIIPISSVLIYFIHDFITVKENPYLANYLILHEGETLSYLKENNIYDIQFDCNLSTSPVFNRLTCEVEYKENIVKNKMINEEFDMNIYLRKHNIYYKFFETFHIYYADEKWNVKSHIEYKNIPPNKYAKLLNNAKKLIKEKIDKENEIIESWKY